jgi:cytidylate kinase
VTEQKDIIGKTMRPMYIMLVGLPGSGKSHLVKEIQLKFSSVSWWVVSTDDYIEGVAKDGGLTYNEVFKDNIDIATKSMNVMREIVLENRCNIIHDQTNLTAKSRAKKLVDIPKEYVKIAIWCQVDEAVRQERLSNRPGKIIPKHVDSQMVSSVEQPRLAEGFEWVVAAEIWETAVKPYVQ